MKKIFIAGLLLIFSSILILLGFISVKADTNPLAGKLIALDAGHGGTDSGAQYLANCYGTDTKCQVHEKDVNLAVVYTLKVKLEADNNLDGQPDNQVVLTRKCDETISSRKSRVDMAIEECKGSYGRKCDVLVSVHHNGSTDPNHDGTMVIYNEKQDIPLANALLETLWPLTGINDGLDHGGYGMTVYGHIVSALTEAYYITNDWEAQQYLNGTSTLICDNNGDSINDYPVLIEDRIKQEADALYQGLLNYFSAPPTKPGGRK